jgi:hypothetical protein
MCRKQKEISTTFDRARTRRKYNIPMSTECMTLRLQYATSLFVKNVYENKQFKFTVAE